MPHFTVTYDVVTPESAEFHDIAECGFIDAHGWKMPVNPGEQVDKPAMTLREALRHIGLLEDGGDGWHYYETDGRDDYQTGANERRALHLADTVTPASADRIARLLQAGRYL